MISGILKAASDMFLCLLNVREADCMVEERSEVVRLLLETDIFGVSIALAPLTGFLCYVLERAAPHFIAYSCS